MDSVFFCVVTTGAAIKKVKIKTSLVLQACIPVNIILTEIRG